VDIQEVVQRPTRQRSDRRRRVLERCLGRLDWLGRRLLGPRLVRVARHLPRSAFGSGRAASPIEPWSDYIPDAPAELLTQPGVLRDASAEETAFRGGPLHDFHAANPRWLEYLEKCNWPSIIPVLPERSRLAATMAEVSRRASNAQAVDVRNREGSSAGEARNQDLTARLKEFGREIGLSAIAVAKFDEKYQFVESAGQMTGDCIIVCAFEQDHADTQTAPSVRAERAAMRAYSGLMERMVRVAEFLESAGFAALTPATSHYAMSLHYVVSAGLGQLGLNGQVLTPAAGSRVRFGLVHTNAPLEFDHAVDYGIEGICDQCQICVRRCPTGALTIKRKPYRGINKAKINTGRCLPAVAQAHGCAVCMKVCPVQKYGLRAVVAEFERSGHILGKGSSDLEAYDWIDGYNYPAGARPRVSEGFLQPNGLEFKPDGSHPSTSDPGTPLDPYSAIDLM
jgi:epoxyqueuosine reductase